MRSFDGEDFSDEVSVFVTIDNSVDNLPPSFDPSGWANTVKVYCDEESRNLNRCGKGAVLDVATPGGGDMQPQPHEMFTGRARRDTGPEGHRGDGYEDPA